MGQIVKITEKQLFYSNEITPQQAIGNVKTFLNNEIKRYESKLIKMVRKYKIDITPIDEERRKRLIEKQIRYLTKGTVCNG